MENESSLNMLPNFWEIKVLILIITDFSSYKEK